MNPAGLNIPSRPTACLSIRITPQQRSALDRLATDLNCGTSALARLALAQGLEQLQKEHA
jgi:predicted transcriptional regulator